MAYAFKCRWKQGSGFAVPAGFELQVISDSQGGPSSDDFRKALTAIGISSDSYSSCDYPCNWDITPLF